MAKPANGRTALVTGASRGIGRAIALGLAGDGFDIVLNDIERQRDELEAVAGEIARIGRRAIPLFADVGNRDQVRAMVATGLAQAGRIDVVVNNAGILIPNLVENLLEQEWDAVMDINAKGTFLVVQAVLPHMRERGYGRIVNIASIGGKHGAPEQAHYSASKAAVMGFTRVLAQEVGQFGITANCVCPGIIVTDMGRTNLSEQASIDKWVGITALRRLGQPEDVVGPACFLASDASAFVTGQSLNVCGGITLS
ncbi:SDR family oxidoreductase [Lichenicola cladoniae]|uniref:SDR family oxidoreductase n=1 Tax=Lichenicola cladoniae TaxID=1484109 RepID=A0A6M8HV21_9PROT|nr:SDR family NAD(P)-dependent oxidoreductase [Lichenicola cladoniae]NPD69444.1 SDR family oxidoreductase [Acetobacteraceae bacterium]QKE92178.1 SDR family oxidoreductase [Lichenicola cladoniae]